MSNKVEIDIVNLARGRKKSANFVWKCSIFLWSNRSLFNHYVLRQAWRSRPSGAHIACICSHIGHLSRHRECHWPSNKNESPLTVCADTYFFQLSRATVGTDWQFEVLSDWYMDFFGIHNRLSLFNSGYNQLVILSFKKNDGNI